MIMSTDGHTFTTERPAAAPEKRRIAAGEIDLPIIYRDCSILNLAIPVDAERVCRLLAGPRITPISMRGRTTMLVTVFEYRDSSVGAYNELSIGFPVRTDLARGLESLGIWVHYLPVTTEIARSAGREIWGYPKWVGEIAWQRTSRTIRVHLPNELELEANLGPRSTVPAPRMRFPFTSFTLKEGRLIRTTIRADAHLHATRGRTCRVEAIGEGRIARVLRTLGADRAKVGFALWSEDFKARLPAGRDLGPSPDLIEPRGV